MAGYTLDVKARKVTGGQLVLEDGTTIPANAAPIGVYAVEFPSGKIIMMTAADFEADFKAADSKAATVPLA